MSPGLSVGFGHGIGFQGAGVGDAAEIVVRVPHACCHTQLPPPCAPDQQIATVAAAVLRCSGCWTDRMTPTNALVSRILLILSSTALLGELVYAVTRWLSDGGRRPDRRDTGSVVS